MAIAANVDLVATALWPQGDARDPLGVWGARNIVTGDATGGSVKTTIQAPDTIAGAYVYTCYSAFASTVSAASASQVKLRLLTNWPDVDPLDPGVQGYGAIVVALQDFGLLFTAPMSGPPASMIGPADRFVLLFDPRPVAGAFAIVELELDENTLARVYAFEAYGYYWDRQVLNTPGGPRHPGAS